MPYSFPPHQTRSEYQRKFMTSHNAPITRADFDKEHFAQWAPRYACALYLSACVLREGTRRDACACVSFVCMCVGLFVQCMRVCRSLKAGHAPHPHRSFHLYTVKYVMMLNDFHVVERHSKRKDIFILKCVPLDGLCMLGFIHVCT